MRIYSSISGILSLLLFANVVWCQTEAVKQLGKLRVEPLPPGSKIFESREHGIVILESDIVGLELHSTLGVVRSEGNAGEQIYYLRPSPQRITISHQDYIPHEWRLNVVTDPARQVQRFRVSSGIPPLVGTDLPQVSLKYTLSGPLDWAYGILDDGAILHLDFSKGPRVVQAAASAHKLQVVTSRGMSEMIVVFQTGVRKEEIITPDSTKKPQRPTTHIVTLETSPPDAQLILNGVMEGSTPWESTQVPAGEYVVQLSKKGFQPLVREIAVGTGDSIATGQEILHLSYALQPNPTRLRVNSAPAGAKVTLSGTELGLTPIDTMLSPREGSLTVSLPAYHAYETPAKLVSDSLHQFDAILKIIGGKLKVTSDPAGATVLLNGDSLGRTPLTTEETPPGTYTVLVRQPGLADDAKAVTIEGSKETAVGFNLTERKPGRLDLDCKVKSAMVSIVDGPLGPNEKRWNLALPHEARVPPGRYVLRFICEHYIPRMDTVWVKDKETLTRRAVELQRGKGDLVIKTSPAAPSVDVIVKGGDSTPGSFRGITDVNGEYALPGLPAGLYEIKVKFNRGSGEASAVVKDQESSTVTVSPRR